LTKYNLRLEDVHLLKIVVLKVSTDLEKKLRLEGLTSAKIEGLMVPSIFKNLRLEGLTPLEI